MALTLKTKTEISDFIRGLTLYGVGGGGDPALGTAKLTEVLEKNGSIEMVDAESLPDDVLTCCVFGMGSVAPTGSRPGAFGQQVRVTRDPNIRAVQELERLTGKKISVVVPSETGGLNTANALHAGAMLGRVLVDGDYCGHAKPELCQSSPVLNGTDVMPFAVCDDWGNVVHVVKAASPAAMEALGKQISIITKAPDRFAVCAHAGMLMTAAEMKRCLAKGSLSKAARVGRAIREARECGKNPPEAAAEAMGGRILFKGIVTAMDWESGGYMSGSTYLYGMESFAGERFKIWFRNENHLAWRNERPTAMSPDVIAVVDLDTGEPITNSVLKTNDRVAVLGAPHVFCRTAAGIAAMGPRHYGFEMDYQPIEALWTTQNDLGSKRSWRRSDGAYHQK